MTPNKKRGIIYLIALFIGIAMGVINPIASTHLERNNVGDLWIGLISSLFFLFMFLGGLFVNKEMSNKDIKIIILSGSIITAAACGCFPFVSSLVVWCILMMIMGTGVSFYTIGAQTMLHSLTDTDSRGFASGLYSFYFALGFVFSSIVGPKLYSIKTWLPFMLPIITLMFAFLLIIITMKEKFLFIEKPKQKVLNKVSVGLHGAFAYGFTETTLVTLYPIFLLHENYSVSNLGYALGIFVIGSVIGTLPLTYIADRQGGEKTLAVSIFIALFAILGIIFFKSFVCRLIFSFVSGVTIGPVYALSLAVTVQNLNNDEVHSGTSLFTSSYGLGSTLGPLASSSAMSLLGNSYIFSICFIILLAFLIRFFVKKTIYSIEADI